MPRPRKHLVCLSRTPYYHITSRCVRRAFLCGIDKQSGQSYEHRRGWLEDRVRVLSSLFSIELCAYTIMSNHYHLVIKLCPAEAETWSDDEVLDRWTSLFQGPVLVQRYRAGETLNPAEAGTLGDMTRVFRRRLQSLSWFMKCLNEPIARQANAEDRCTGHFWEARFHSQPLCSDQAVCAAMAYVDLNPIRAELAKTPEQSDHTSIRARLTENPASTDLTASISRLLKQGDLNHFNAPIRPLMKFSEVELTIDASNQPMDTLPMVESEYFKLVDTTGRVLVQGKRGRIDPALAPILSRLKLSTEQWLQVSTSFRLFYRQGQLRVNKVA